jgi:serine/threonine-protein kinase
MSEAPHIIGRYALYGKIASGGMATVHLGSLLGPVGFSRTVAIKRMHPQLIEESEFVSMFLDEARLAARIRHPNVVPTLDVVATEAELFLVMEYIHGDTLARLLRRMAAERRTAPLPIVAAIFSGVLHGLHAAHEAKNERGEPLRIVHRDVSPQNIIVGTDGVPRVLDFGVAKATGRLQTTVVGQLKGKIAYMAPEQVQGKGATRQTDIYAVSAVLWEALVGTRLFKDDKDAAMLQRVLDGEVLPPSVHSSAVSAEVDALVMRGLDRDPGKRFGTAREMAAAIEAALPLAIPVQVGEWVEATAGAMLVSQAARVAEIETGHSDATAAPPAAVVAPPPEAAQAPAAEPASDPTLFAEYPPVFEATIEAGAVSQMSSISVAAAPSAAPSAEATEERRKTARRVAGALLVATVLIGVTALIVRASHRAVPSEQPRASGPEMTSSPATSTTETHKAIARPSP